MGSGRGIPVKLGVLRGAQFALGLALQLQPVRAVDQPVEHGVRDGRIAEHVEMPHRLIVESLGSG